MHERATAVDLGRHGGELGSWFSVWGTVELNGSTRHACGSEQFALMRQLSM